VWRVSKAYRPRKIAPPIPLSLLLPLLGFEIGQPALLVNVQI
jgi:hypothetical protein